MVTHDDTDATGTAGGQTHADLGPGTGNRDVGGDADAGVDGGVTVAA
jgi:hypothetical protein